MSFTVLVIAAIPAVVVIIVAESSQSRLATLATSLIAGLAGLLLGNPVYTLLDVVCVVLAAYFFWPSVDPERVKAVAADRARRKAYYDSAEYKAQERQLDRAVIVVGVLVYAAYAYWQFKPSVSGTTPVPSAAPQQPAQSSASPQVHPTSKTEATEGRPRQKGADLSPKPTFQRCVEIRDEQKMQKCLERLQ